MIMTTLFSTLTGNAQTALPAPDKTGGATIMEALWNRKACREFSDRSLTEQQLANLLWAATGLATVIRGTMDREALQKLLGLNPGQEPMLNCPVGYAK